MVAMWGWFSAARSCASRSKRAMRCGSEANASGMIFRATSRPSRESVARYTSPIPPAPIFSVTRKCAMVWPIIARGPKSEIRKSKLENRGTKIRGHLRGHGPASQRKWLGIFPTLPGGEFPAQFVEEIEDERDPVGLRLSLRAGSLEDRYAFAVGVNRKVDACTADRSLGFRPHAGFACLEGIPGGGVCGHHDPVGRCEV